MNQTLAANSCILSAEELLQASDGVINSKFSVQDVEFALRHIADEVTGTNKYTLNRVKVQKAIALQLLNEIPDGFRLHEFIQALKNAFELGIPSAMESQLISSLEIADDHDQQATKKSRPNLFDHFIDFDLSFLAGFAYIIPY